MNKIAFMSGVANAISGFGRAKNITKGIYDILDSQNKYDISKIVQDPNDPLAGLSNLQAIMQRDAQGKYYGNPELPEEQGM